MEELPPISEFVIYETKRMRVPTVSVATELIVAANLRRDRFKMVPVEYAWLAVPGIVTAVIDAGASASLIATGLAFVGTPIQDVRYDDAALLHWCHKNGDGSSISVSHIELNLQAINERYGTQLNSRELGLAIGRLQQLKAVKCDEDGRMVLYEKVKLHGWHNNGENAG